MYSTRTGRTVGILTGALMLVAAGCGSSGDANKAADQGDGNLAAYCKVAKAVNAADGPPTTPQLRQLRKLAPAEIREQANTAATPLIAAGDDPIAGSNAFGDDDVEAAIEIIDAFDAENCDIRGDDPGPGEGAVYDIDPAATRVDVTLRDFAFDVPGPIAAGPTSFVVTNEGAEAHFMALVKLADGATLAQALQSEDEKNPFIAGEWSTKVAAAGNDEESMTLDLEPGNYGMVCFIAGADGTPHAFSGMQYEFTVA